MLLHHVKSYQDKWVIITVFLDRPLNSVSLVRNEIYLKKCGKVDNFVIIIGRKWNLFKYLAFMLILFLQL